MDTLDKLNIIDMINDSNILTEDSVLVSFYIYILYVSQYRCFHLLNVF